jgi:photosystem II stability/assembly factor-like uncharacterized protein
MKRAAIFLALSISALALPQFDRGGGPVEKTLPSEGPIANMLAPLTARSIGPVNMGGRIMDIAVYDKAPRIYFVASASGGLFRTDNAGLSFTPIFDRESSISLGAVAVNQSNPDDIWVGTGEQSSRNSIAWGDGVYHTTDGGKTWQHMGLRDTRHISEVLIDPRDPNTILVGALGRLWGPNPERGMYKSTDGGKTWKLVLYVNENTGVIDIARDPKNPNNLLAAMWNRRREPFDFVSGGPGSGMYRSTDGGSTWNRVTKGLPNQQLGRIGISYFHDDPRIVTATIEHGALPGEPVRNEQGAVRNFGGGIYRSTDGGQSWTRVNNRNPRPFYFSRPEQDPVDPNRIYLLEVNLGLSTDGGKTFTTMPNRVHSDYHAAWINPNDPYQMLVGTDGGIYETRDQGKTWEMHNKMAIGQFYAVAFDMRKPYWVYGGLQDNGSWGHPTQSIRGGVAFYDTVSLSGGDGFHVQADPEDWTTVYSESQGGAIQRIDLKNGGGRSIRPRGEGLRFNWSTPFILSPHNSKTIYVGSNKLFRSNNRGDTWEAISPDLSTMNPNKQRPGKLSTTPEDTGAETHCTIITISESRRTPGLIYVGTDDGLVWVTRDGGQSWTELTPNIKGVPANTWVSRVLASKNVEGRVYVTFDGHRSNDFKPYIFVSEDFGKTWTSLAGGLPDWDCLYVVTEGEKNPDLLFLGSEMGLRVSMDRGQSWTKYRGNFPTVAVHDLKIHPRELDLIIGTHGRSIWTMDVNGLEGMTKEQLAKDVALARPQTVYSLGRVGSPWFGGDSLLLTPNSQPGTRVFYYLKQPVSGDVKVKISSADEVLSDTLNGTNNAGMNAVSWNGRLGGRNVPPGDYRVTVIAGDKEFVTSVKVEDLSGNRNE